MAWENKGEQGKKEFLAGYSALNTVWVKIGAEIAADSDSEKELYESLHKAREQ